MPTRRKLLKKDEVDELLKELEKEYPDAGCELEFDSVYHLLIAVVLSAQTTDVSVNKVTPKLFSKYRRPEDLAAADINDVIETIKQIGLYKNKAANIIALSQRLVEDYDGEVPGTFDELVKLPGVGRKTANVVLAEAFGEQRIAVDTHVFRVSNRLGLAYDKDVNATEERLMKTLPKEGRVRAHHLLIFHGRRCCHARKPSCDTCPVAHICLANSGMN